SAGAVVGGVVPVVVWFFFFFSSRRRHTRCLSDWSSDVCSSDLIRSPAGQSCTAGERILVHEDVRDAYLGLLTAAIEREIHLGDQIGRASCRERGGASAGGAAVEEARQRDRGALETRQTSSVRAP